LNQDPVVLVDCPYAGWHDQFPAVEDLCQSVARITLAAAASGLDLPIERLEVSLVLDDDQAVRILNRDYRGLDKPTNVLSFAALDEDSPIPEDGPILLGDVIIAFQTCMAEAEADHKKPGHHLSHLVVHGVLHLLGYDHEAEDEAEQMESLERSILGAMGIPDPYRDDPI
jgi:probable rRNA maturation factor